LSNVVSGLQPTLYIAAGGIFEKKTTGGNAVKKYEDEISEKYFRTSQALY